MKEDELFDFVYHGGWYASDEREAEAGEEDRNALFPQVFGEVAGVRNAVSVDEKREMHHISREVKKEDLEDLHVAEVLKGT